MMHNFSAGEPHGVAIALIQEHWTSTDAIVFYATALRQMKPSSGMFRSFFHPNRDEKVGQEPGLRHRLAMMCDFYLQSLS